MKTLKTLIRLKKDEVDGLKKELAQIEERQRILLDEHADLANQLENEAAVAAEFPEIAASFAAFAKRTVTRQKNLMKTIQILQAAIDKKRDELLVEFGELKKFEIALDQQQIAAFNESKRRDSIAMDEVAIRGFVRKDL